MPIHYLKGRKKVEGVNDGDIVLPVVELAVHGH